MVGIADIQRTLSDMGRRLDLIEGIRDAAVGSLREREARLAHLATLDSFVQKTSDLDGVRVLLSDILRQAGLRRVVSADESPEAFTQVVVDEGAAGVRLAAYIDEYTGRVVQQGRTEVAPAEELNA